MYVPLKQLYLYNFIDYNVIIKTHQKPLKYFVIISPYLYFILIQIKHAPRICLLLWYKMAADTEKRFM